MMMALKIGYWLLAAYLAVCLVLIVWIVAANVVRAADLPLLSTTDSTFNLGCELAVPGEGDEMCFIIDTLPVIELVCGAPDASSIFRADLAVIKGQTTNYRCYTKLGTVQSASSVDSKPVEGIPLPPTVLE